MEYIKIPVGNVTSAPTQSKVTIAVTNDYWFVTDDNCILCFGKSGFQHNPHEELFKRIEYPFEGSVMLIPIVYLQIEIHEFEYNVSDMARRCV